MMRGRGLLLGGACVGVLAAFTIAAGAPSPAGAHHADKGGAPTLSSVRTLAAATSGIRGAEFRRRPDCAVCATNWRIGAHGHA